MSQENVEVVRRWWAWAAVWTVRSGKAVRAQGYMSRAEALEAVGLRE